MDTVTKQDDRRVIKMLSPMVTKAAQMSKRHRHDTFYLRCFKAVAFTTKRSCSQFCVLIMPKIGGHRLCSSNTRPTNQSQINQSNQHKVHLYAHNDTVQLTELQTINCVVTRNFLKSHRNQQTHSYVNSLYKVQIYSDLFVVLQCYHFVGEHTCRCIYTSASAKH